MTSVFSNTNPPTEAQPVEGTVEQPSHQLLSLVAESGHRNIRRHWQRDAIRVSALVLFDAVTFLVIREVLLGARAGALGSWLADAGARLWAVELLAGASFLFAVIIGLALVGAYGAGDLRRDSERVFAGVALAGLFALYPQFWSVGFVATLAAYVIVVLPVAAGLMVERWIADWVAVRVGSIFGVSRVILVGDTEMGVSLPGEEPRFRGAPMEIVGAVGVTDDGGEPVGPAIDELGQLIHDLRADTVFVRRPLAHDDFAYVVDLALASGCRLLAGSRMADVSGVEPRAVRFRGQTLVELTAPHRKGWQLAVKRLVDLVGALLGIIALFPLFVGVSLALKLGSPGPVFYRSARWGRHGRRIRIWKFRTMVDGAAEYLKTDEQLHAAFASNAKLVNDPRVTRVGGWLRRWSIDELPQLINVLTGDMSLVGPRPKLADEGNEEHRYGDAMATVLSVRPGLTGLWQISGRNGTSYEERIRLDVMYVTRASLWWDVRILLRTLPVVVKGHGAH